MTITYKLRSDGKTNVRLDGRVVGVIVFTINGYRYRPLGTRKEYGEPFATMAECQKSLEQS